MNTVTFVEDALRTARHTVRLIRTQPRFVLTVVMSLALGIGANTAIFSVVHRVLIQPLPYPHADALVGIYNRLTISGQVYEDAALSPGMYAACRDDCRAFEHVGVWSSGAATVTGAGEAEQVASVTVTHGCTPCVRDTCLAGPLVLAGRRFTGRRSNGDPQPRVLATKIRRRPGDSRPYCRDRFRSAPDRRRDAAGVSLRGPVA